MSELRVKSSVRPRSLVIAAAVINAANELALPVNMLITSGNDSKHMAGSAHGFDKALDFRTKHLSVEDKKLLIIVTKRRLGKNYEVSIHSKGTSNEHLHIEYDPA